MTTTSLEKHDKTDWNIYNEKKENHFTPLVVHIINVLIEDRNATNARVFGQAH